MPPTTSQGFLPLLRFTRSGAEAEVGGSESAYCMFAARGTAINGVVGRQLVPFNPLHTRRTLSTGPSAHHDDCIPPAQPAIIRDGAAVSIAWSPRRTRRRDGAYYCTTSTRARRRLSRGAHSVPEDTLPPTSPTTTTSPVNLSFFLRLTALRNRPKTRDA